MKFLLSIFLLSSVAFPFEGHALDSSEAFEGAVAVLSSHPPRRSVTQDPEPPQASFPSKKAYDSFIKDMKDVVLQDPDYVLMIGVTHGILRSLELQGWDLWNLVSSYQSTNVKSDKERYAQLMLDNFYDFVKAIFFYFECAVTDAAFQVPNPNQPEGYGSLDNLGVIYQSRFKKQFSIVQGLWNECLRIFKHHSFVNESDVYGAFQNKHVGFYHGNGGIIFFPILRNGIQYIFPKYGDLGGGNFRAFMVENGQFHSDSGFVLEYNEDTLYPYSISLFSGATGEKPFSRETNFMDIRVPRRDLIDDPIQIRMYENCRSFFDFDRATNEGVDFVPVPQTPAQYLEAEYQFLRAIEASAENPRAEDHKNALLQKVAIEEKMGIQLGDYVESVKETLVDAYAEEVRREQEGLQAKREEEQRRKEKKNQKKKKRNLTKGSSSSVEQEGISASEEIRTEARRRAAAFFNNEQGHLKWKKVIRLLNGVFRNYPALIESMQVNVTGSHITYHSSEGSLTLAPRHGGQDSTLPVGVVRTFTEGLINNFMQMNRTVNPGS